MEYTFQRKLFLQFAMLGENLRVIQKSKSFQTQKFSYAFFKKKIELLRGLEWCKHSTTIEHGMQYAF